MEYNKVDFTEIGRSVAAEMKVLMIPSWYPTAEAPLLGTFYKEQAEALAARGVDVARAVRECQRRFPSQP